MTATAAPRRIQLSRRRGWRKPKGAVVVARPSRWGNPYRVERRDAPHGLWVDWAVVAIDSGEVLAWPSSEEAARQQAVALFHRALLAGRLPFTVADVRSHLAGRDLACWCPPDQPCHADTLLSVAGSRRAGAA